MIYHRLPRNQHKSVTQFLFSVVSISGTDTFQLVKCNDEVSASRSQTDLINSVCLKAPRAVRVTTNYLISLIRRVMSLSRQLQFSLIKEILSSSANCKMFHHTYIWKEFISAILKLENCHEMEIKLIAFKGIG